jgi:hypothetical protein
MLSALFKQFINDVWYKPLDRLLLVLETKFSGIKFIGRAKPESLEHYSRTGHMLWDPAWSIRCGRKVHFLSVNNVWAVVALSVKRLAADFTARVRSPERTESSLLSIFEFLKLFLLNTSSWNLWLVSLRIIFSPFIRTVLLKVSFLPHRKHTVSPLQRQTD